MRALLALALVGCGPNLQTLASKRHYREAVCAANDGSGDDRAFVRRALTKDADPHIHVEVVRHDQLARALAGASSGERDRIAGRAQFVRVQLRTHVVPVDGLDASVDLVEPGGGSLGHPATWEQLAEVTGEKLPPKQTHSSYLHGGTLLRGAAAFFTLGLSLPFTTFRRRSYETDAPDEAYLMSAPLAHALRDATAYGGGCRAVPSRSTGHGLACTWYLAIDPADRQREVALSVSLAYRSARKTEGHCAVRETQTIKLGRIDALAQRTTKTFGPRMRALRDFTIE
ncbi:MAG: hypothetical protein H0V17_12240 [Deltaproteobacteria bacterium]|nr:hypothetical protein [Deltaproteobacteria bacterium]